MLQKPEWTKIFYGTRTHKQLAQVVQELRRIPQEHIKHTILGSREHTCVHEIVSKAPEKNKACKETLDSGNCKYFKQYKARYDRPGSLRRKPELKGIWDIEDLVRVGRNKESKGKDGFCPYFAATRSMAQDANLTFCPYNYLIDPRLRKTMDVVLKGAVVILDEAHNIEDACREALSFVLEEHALIDAIKDLDALTHSPIAQFNESVMSALRYLRNCLDKFHKFLCNEAMDDKEAPKLGGKPSGPQDRQRSYTYTGRSAIQIFKAKDLGIGPDGEYRKWLELASAALNDPEEEHNKNGAPKPLNAATFNTLEELGLIAQYLTPATVDDYMMRVEESERPSSPVKKSRRGHLASQTLSRSDHKQYILHLWCFNPALAFRDAFLETRSVIVASGTMSPFTTFEGELGMDFKVRFEGKHVIQPDQLFACALHQGPSGGALKGVRATFDSQSFLEEMGRVILHVSLYTPSSPNNKSILRSAESCQTGSSASSHPTPS